MRRLIMIIKQNVNVTNFSNIDIKIQMTGTAKWEAVKGEGKRRCQ